MNTTLERVCRLPIGFHTVGKKSLTQLLDESGYTVDSESVTESKIAACLSVNFEWCDAWLGYSQDRRTNCGWVIAEESGGYVVYYFPNENERLRFKDKCTACAAFAIRELKTLVT